MQKLGEGKSHCEVIAGEHTKKTHSVTKSEIANRHLTRRASL